MLELEALGKRYGRLDALRDVSFAAYEAEIVGLLGPNGAGKTTMIRLLTTMLAPTSGRFSVAGVPGNRPAEIRRRVGVLPESAGYPAGRTGADHLRFHARLYGSSRRRAAEVADTLLAEVGLADVADTLVSTYSRGMRQRLGIARALVNDPAVVFLDEPTLGLDPAGHARLLAMLRDIAERRRATVVLSTHALADVEEICERVVILDRGRVVAAGPVAEVVDRAVVPGGARVTVPAQAVPAALETLAGVDGLSVVASPQRPGLLELTSTGAAPDAGLHALVASGVPVLGWEVERARLGDAFRVMTAGTSTTADGAP
jgi:ABC-2 type transport system ATP-binding protein